MRRAFGAALFSLVAGHALASFSPPAQITVVSDDNYPPYLFRDADGRLQGILRDKWELWSRRTGVAVKLEGTDWAEAQRRVVSGGTDVIDAMSYTEARARLYEYSPSWGTVETRIFFHRSIGGINDVASMRGFAVGTKDGSACTNWLKEHGIEAVRPYPNSDALVRAAGAGEVRLFCMDTPIAQYYLFKQQLADEFRQAAPIYTAHLHWATAKGRTELRNFILGGFQRLDADELQEIDARWLGNPLKLPIDARYFYYLGAAAAAMLAAAALLLAWNRTLSARVAARTRDLGERVTALRESEARLTLSIRSSGIGLWDWSIADNRVYFSPEWKGMLGYRDDEIPFRHGEWESRLHPEDKARVLARLQACLRNPGLEYENEFRMRHKDGSFRWIYARGELQRDADGRPLRMLGCHMDITERKQAAEEMQRHAERLRTLSQKLMDVEENERRNINRELHDRVGQNLSALQLSLGTLRMELARRSPPEVNSRLDDAQSLLETTSSQVRDVMTELRPAALDDYGLLAAVRHHAGAVGARLGIPFAVKGNEIKPRLPLATETALFRIVQEALNNVAKHARARHVKVTLSSVPACVRLSVIDDGAGFDATRPAPGSSYGLATMHERAEAVGANLRIESKPGKGTRVEVELTRSPA